MKAPRLFIMFAWVHDSCLFLQSRKIKIFIKSMYLYALQGTSALQGIIILWNY